ncbi:unnamed protein product [Amoebophrya sp. A25]|nr:unnamed protein product [Amoebophrya sp. A25]|eukprot:GSA25T00018343001.1
MTSSATTSRAVQQVAALFSTAQRSALKVRLLSNCTSSSLSSGSNSLRTSRCNFISEKSSLRRSRGGTTNRMQQQLGFGSSGRYFSATSGGEYEASVAATLQSAFGNDAQVKVIDRSGGCGTSYEIQVESTKFEGKSRLQRERLVQQPIRAEIEKWHAVTIKTYLPEDGTS